MLTEMNAENNQASVVEEAVSAKMIQAVTIVSAHEDTEWMSEEASVLISMNAVVVLLLVHVVETAKTYQDLSDVTADKDSLQQCLDVAVLMLMSAPVVAETHVDLTNNVKILQEASSVVARGNSLPENEDFFTKDSKRKLCKRKVLSLLSALTKCSIFIKVMINVTL